MADARATSTKAAFRRSCSVAIEINAAPERVWALLTDAAGMAGWNSTVTSVEGRIAAGERLTVNVPTSKRPFKLKVSEFAPPHRMTWSSGGAPMFKGVRVFEVTPSATGSSFSMSETFQGLMLPMIGRTLPDFVPVFEQYAADLKQAAEAGSKEGS